MKLIGLCGLDGAGKDTVADILCSEHNFTKVGIADPLKRFAGEVLGFSRDVLWGPSEFRKPVRPALKALGEGSREASPSGLITYALAVAHSIQSGGHFYVPEFGLVQTPCSAKHVVIKDCRRLKEITAVKQDGGEIWAVTGESSEMPGDIHIINCDRVIENISSLERLRWEVNRASERSHAH